MKKFAVLILGLLITMTSFGLQPVHASGSATLWLSPHSTSVSTGDSFSVDVLFTPNGESIDTARINLDFDASVLEVISYERGDLFPYALPSNWGDNSTGELSVGAYKFGDQIDYSGTLFTLNFHAFRSGTVEIHVSDDSMLINDGDEKLDSSSLGLSTITVAGAEVEKIGLEYFSDGDVDFDVTGDEAVVTDTTTTTTTEADAELEAQALVYFGAFYARMPSNGNDWQALHCIAYGGCQGDPRDVQAEEDALELFGEKYATMPSTDMEWNVLHTIAYTDLLTYDSQDADAEEDTTVDTDGDGLSDHDETNTWGTDPQTADTDGDGYNDGSEVEGGYNPNGEGLL
jgi:hypothetical protein